MHAAKVCSDGEMMRTGIEVDDDGKGKAEAVLCCAVQCRNPPLRIAKWAGFLGFLGATVDDKVTRRRAGSPSEGPSWFVGKVWYAKDAWAGIGPAMVRQSEENEGFSRRSSRAVRERFADRIRTFAEGGWRWEVDRMERVWCFGSRPRLSACQTVCVCEWVIVSGRKCAVRQRRLLGEMREVR